MNKPGYDKQYRLTHKEQIKAYNHKYAMEHKKERSLYNKEYNQRPEAKAYQKKWDAEHPESRAKSIKKYKEANPEKMLLSKYKITDKQKHQTCDLTVKWLKLNITNQPCYYCGKTHKIGCDRIDNNKGHTKKNVLPCCKNCNWVRGNLFTVEEMLVLGKGMKKIMKNRLKNHIV